MQDQRAVVAEMREDALALGEILGDALVRVIADALVEARRLLRHHAQAVLEAGERHAPFRVHVDGAVDVRPSREHAAMQREAGAVDAGLLVEVVAHVDLDEIGGRHLGPQSSWRFIRNLLSSPGTRMAQ